MLINCNKCGVKPGLKHSVFYVWFECECGNQCSIKAEIIGKNVKNSIARARAYWNHEQDLK